MMILFFKYTKTDFLRHYLDIASIPHSGLCIISEGNARHKR